MELMREERARRDTGDRDARGIELAVGRERRDRNSGVLGKARRRHKREEKRAQAQSFCEGRFVMTNRRSLSAGGRRACEACDVTSRDAGHGQGGPPKGPAGPRSARPPEPTDTLNCRVSSGFRPAPRPEITREATRYPTLRHGDGDEAGAFLALNPEKDGFLARSRRLQSITIPGGLSRPGLFFAQLLRFSYPSRTGSLQVFRCNSCNDYNDLPIPLPRWLPIREALRQ